MALFGMFNVYGNFAHRKRLPILAQEAICGCDQAGRIENANCNTATTVWVRQLVNPAKIFLADLASAV